MLDETIVTEIPPLYNCYGRIGQQVCVPIIGTRAKRVLHGAINVWTGEVILLITDVWDEQTHQFFLQMVRNHWRGWNIWLYQDRGSPHTTEDSQELALDLGFTSDFYHLVGLRDERATKPDAVFIGHKRPTQGQQQL